jgi:hypothetical protein
MLKYDLKHPLATALQEAYITMFDEFRSIEVADVGDYTIEDTTNNVKSKLQSNMVFLMLDIWKISKTLIVMIQLNGILKHTINGLETATLLTLTQ